MSSGARIVAFGAISPLGRGDDALGLGALGDVARTASFAAPELEAAGLARPFAAQVPGLSAGPERAQRVIEAALGDLVARLDEMHPPWRKERVGLVVGTSSGAMRQVEARASTNAPFDEEDAMSVLYAAPLHAALRRLLPDVLFRPFSLVLGACASSTIALGLGMRWLESGACDLVLAGGFDAESVLVSAGFEALRATTETPPPRPFHPQRDGLALGEGAAFLALARAQSGERALVGFGASCDAFHITAPPRGGEGLSAAALHALADAEAGAGSVALVSAHGTATPFNDAAEACSLADVLPGFSASSQGRVHVHAYKSQSGHVLGAAGALELLAAERAIDRAMLPASAGVDESSEAPLLARAIPFPAHDDQRHVLKLSAAFGGANAALVTGPARRAPRPSRAVYVHPAVAVALTGELPEVHETKLGRFDSVTRGVLAAVHALVRRRSQARAQAGVRSFAPRTGLVVGHTLATFETNIAYARRIAARGARGAEPRRFPYTSPNACAGEAAIAFQLTGPVFAVGNGLSAGVEALAVAAALVAAGDADDVVVVAVDAPGDAWSSLGKPLRIAPGAVATIVSCVAEEGGFHVTGWETGIRAGTPCAPSPDEIGHRALASLVVSAPPRDRGAFDKMSSRTVASRCPSGAIARVHLDPV